MWLKPLKCEFHQTETEYLEFIVSQDGIKVDAVKTKAYKDRGKTYSEERNTELPRIL